MTDNSSKHAIILFAHGSRDALWRRPIEAVAEQVKQSSPSTHVACAYLELTEPDLPTTVARLVQAGVNMVRIVPMFLGVAGMREKICPCCCKTSSPNTLV